jgi:NitT/TauT family transport system ATP-binding protein
VTSASAPAAPIAPPARSLSPAVPAASVPPGGGEPGRPAVALSGVGRTFGSGAGAVEALAGIDLVVPSGEFTCLVGASGCGKTTLLNLLAGLDHPSEGRSLVAGRPALLFQEAALFPWLTAAANVELALRLRGVPARKRRARAAELLDVVRLADFGGHRPHELSGGMRQRVALARALAQEADLLLMDEPFGALDAMTRDLLHDEVEQVWARTGATVVFVTHNVREAVRLADRVVLLSSRPGRVAEQFSVEVPRPRRIESPEVAALAARITARLRQEVASHGRA